MKKLAVLLAALLLAWNPAGAGALSVRQSAEQAMEACRVEAGLLPDSPGEALYSSGTIMLEMKLWLIRNDRERFEKTCQRLVRYFQSPLKLLYRNLGEDLKPVAWGNDTGTDLACCRILLDASRKWGVPAYQEKALKLAGRILRFNRYRGVLINSVSWRESRTGLYRLYPSSRRFRLDSLDLQALRSLQGVDRQWEQTAQRTLGILATAVGSSEPKLVYDVEKGQYQPVLQVMGATPLMRLMSNLIEGGLVPKDSLDLLRKKLRRDPMMLTRGKQKSLTASLWAVSALKKSGCHDEALQLLRLTEQEFGTKGMLAENGEPPLISDTLLYLIVCEDFQEKSAE